MQRVRNNEHVETLVIGGGQAGLSVGYHLARHGLSFQIVDAAERIGDAWRGRWDSLRLFTPARWNGLDGLPFPGDPRHFPTKDEMGDYLETYASTFSLPVRSGVRIDRLTHGGDRYVATAGERRFTARSVVVAMADYQQAAVPSFAGDLSSDMVQMHSADYRNRDQLQDGPVLLVGAGNSAADIAMELASTHPVWMAGSDVGHVPFRLEWAISHRVLIPMVLRVVFHRILTVSTPMGRRKRARSLHRGVPLIRVKPRDLSRAGVVRLPRVTGVEDGNPVLENGLALAPATVIWCTGFQAGFDWIDLPVHGDQEPRHHRGVVESHPDLYFVGLSFLHAVSSSMIHGVGRDAERIAGIIAARAQGHSHAGPGDRIRAVA